MQADTTERPNVQERYETAGNTSNLSVEAEKPGAGDVLIAAGWSQSRLGMALLRLHSEWSSAAKPARLPSKGLQALAVQLKEDDAQAKSTAERKGIPYTKPGAVAARAQAEADRWYANELRILASGLKSRPVVWEQLGGWAAVKGVPSVTVAAALLHWLAPNCPHCVTGLRKVPGAPALSARQCHRCNGTGHRPHPIGTAKVLAYMDDCCQKARTSLKRRLRHE